MPKITDIGSIPLEDRWTMAVSAVRTLIYRRQQPDSYIAVMQSDPNGDLILTQDLARRLAPGMSIQSAIERIGSQPYRDEHPLKMTWFTMGGPCLTVGIRLGVGCITKVDLTGLYRTSLDAYERQIFLSTRDVVRYFILHANGMQRTWLLSAIEEVPSFEVVDVSRWGPRMREVYSVKAPVLTGDHMFNRLPVDKQADDWLVREFGGNRLSQYFDGNIPEPFGVRNSLSEADADKLWKRILESGSSDMFRSQKKAQKAMRLCDSTCSTHERQALIAFFRNREFRKAESLAHEISSRGQRERLEEYMSAIRKFETSQKKPVGRSYKTADGDDVWSCYQYVLYHRDDLRCQHCGRNEFELDDASLHMDHVVPLAKGGETCLNNLQLLCSECNARKGTKKEEEFPAEVRAKWYKNRTRTVD
jgi:hypothetical protein